MAGSPIIPNTIRGRFSDLRVENDYALVSSARKGIKPKVFYDFADSIKMPEKILAILLNLSS